MYEVTWLQDCDVCDHIVSQVWRAKLKGTAKTMSPSLQYSWQDSSPLTMEIWKRAWQGDRAIKGSAFGFQPHKIILLSLSLISTV